MPTWRYIGTIGIKIKYNFLCALDIKTTKQGDKTERETDKFHFKLHIYLKFMQKYTNNKVTPLNAKVIKGMHIFCMKLTFLSYIHPVKQSCYELGSGVKYMLLDEG